MHVNNVRNVNAALAAGLGLLNRPGHLTEDTRNGKVRSWPTPVTTVTDRPMERVLFSPYRNANPFFHLMESLWMLAGRNDLPWLTQFNQQMAAYSDDGGKTQPAAYGHRWREFFGYDQIALVVEELKERPNSRRAVLAMFDPGDQTEPDVHAQGYREGDMQRALNGSKDVPCNTHCYFRILGGALEMTVCCRSNDILWGAHGANAVHFSVLQEYIAAKLRLAVGPMYQMSNNYHVYEEVVKYPLDVMAASCMTHDYYATGVKPTPLFTPLDIELFDQELPAFMQYASPDGGLAHLKHPTFTTLACPMVDAWRQFKAGEISRARAELLDMQEGDWRLACDEWLKRRAEK